MIVIRGMSDNTLSEKNFALYNYLKGLFLLVSWVCDFFFHFERHLCFLEPIPSSLCYRQSSISHCYLHCNYLPTPHQEGNCSVPTGQFDCPWCFFFWNDEGRYSFRSEAGRNTTKVARDACISLSHRRMVPVYFGSYQVLLRIPAKHMLITIHSVLKLHLFWAGALLWHGFRSWDGEVVSAQGNILTTK